MKDRERNRPTRISLSACSNCRVTAEPAPGGRACPSCEQAMVTALVILPRSGATIERAASLLLDTLERMRAGDPAR